MPVKRIGEFDDIIKKRMQTELDTRSRQERFADAWDRFNKKYDKEQM